MENTFFLLEVMIRFDLSQVNGQRYIKKKGDHLFGNKILPKKYSFCNFNYNIMVSDFTIQSATPQGTRTVRTFYRIGIIDVGEWIHNRKWNAKISIIQLLISGCQNKCWPPKKTLHLTNPKKSPWKKTFSFYSPSWPSPSLLFRRIHFRLWLLTL